MTVMPWVQRESLVPEATEAAMKEEAALLALPC
jgi:hypothetical protein